MERVPEYCFLLCGILLGLLQQFLMEGGVSIGNALQLLSLARTRLPLLIGETSD